MLFVNFVTVEEEGAQLQLRQEEDLGLFFEYSDEQRLRLMHRERELNLCGQTIAQSQSSPETTCAQSFHNTN